MRMTASIKVGNSVVPTQSSAHSSVDPVQRRESGIMRTAAYGTGVTGIAG